LSSAEVVVDDGEVATGGMVDLEHSIHNVFPKTHTAFTWRGEREKREFIWAEVTWKEEEWQTDMEREKNRNKERREATDCKAGSLYRCKVEHVAELLTQFLVQ